MERKSDFERFRLAVTTSEPAPVTIGDIYADAETMSRYLGEPVERYGGTYVPGAVKFYSRTGWDFCTSFSRLNFPGMPFGITENTSTEVEDGYRGWLDDNQGPISSWETFEQYQWPEDVEFINRDNRQMASLVPNGMKVMVIPGGVFEWTTWLIPS